MTKGRLAQRLLNTRGRDAITRQLIVEEDENYIEAFPNRISLWACTVTIDAKNLNIRPKLKVTIT
ncbi:hypothetical protein RJ641_015082 [Dillenia turbinata]|uniref:Uncharacterized protein n=1 Tax=Dillenia turbinata TaxID=194707 RepID=A0AAN8YZZ5_9MAGN